MTNNEQISTENVLDIDARQFITNKWSRTFIQPILIALMITSFFTCVFVVINNFIPTPAWILLTPLLFFVTLESIFTTMWLSHPDRRTLNHTYYRISEFLVIALITRVYIWMIVGGWPQFDLLGDYLRYPWVLVNDGVFVLAILAIAFSWFYARMTSYLFTRLALDEAEVTYYVQPAKQREAGNQPVMRNRKEITEMFFVQWMWGCGFLIVIVAIATIDLPTVTVDTTGLGLTRLGLSPFVVFGALFYFLAGLGLLSEARFETLNARWLYLNAQKEPQVERIWYQYGLWFLVLVGIFAAFLPLGSTSLVGQAIEQILLIITGLITVLGYFLVMLFSLLFAPFAPPHIAQTPQASTPIPTPTLAPTPIPTIPPIVDDTPALIASSLLWAIAIVGMIMAFMFFVRGRGVKLDCRIFITIFNSLRAFLSSLWGGVVDQIEDIGEAIQLRRQVENKGDEEEGEGFLRPFRLFRINSLSPEEQIRYFYLSTLKRAQNKGVSRETSETPIEFMDDLKTSWPEAEEEIDTLTEAFLKARYSPRHIEKEEINHVKEKWKRAKSRLRKRVQKAENQGP